MSDEAAAQELLARQKEQCIFCKIIKGDVPGRIVYQDDLLVALLDIRPAARGHVLVMPKEHYPIMPLVPFPTMQHVLRRTHELIGALKEAVLCSSVSLVIANGAAAQQQSPHFLFHLIPREPHDALDILTPPAKQSGPQNEQACKAITPHLAALMDAYLREVGRSALRANPPAAMSTPPAAPTSADHPEEASAQARQERLDALIALINENEDLQEALIERPEEVKEAATKYEKWRKLFEGVDIDQLSQNLRVMAAARQKQTRGAPR